tara:strand:- start:9230 stop:10714 length:1485 start_codon:yes stop_codon:yes gene_type:complete
MIENNIDLINYSHNRKSHYKTTADEIYNLINKFTDQKELEDLYNYFNDKYNLPKSVIRQSIRQYLARSYLFKSGKFKRNLKIENFKKYTFKYTALFYALFFVRTRDKKKNYKLIIDNITSPLELKRFDKLINLIGKDNVLCVTRDENLQKQFNQYAHYNKKIFRNINFVDLFRSIFNEFISGIWLVKKISTKVNVNLLPITLNILQSYLTFKSLFEMNKAKFLIQGKHYNSEPIKNYLFKRSGGNASTSIQKNIIQLDPIFFYVDLDILFSLGDGGCERLREYGGRVDFIQPVGSLFMEYSWFSKKTKINKKYDIAVIGINTSNAYERLDSYNEFMDDVYSIYRWVAKLSLEKPEYEIAVIHHASAGEDKVEKAILSGSNVKVLDKNDNSYEIAFSSKMALTYGSTMGYELNSHNLPTFFIDPGDRCSFLPERGNHCFDKLRINSYDKLKSIVKDIINKKEAYTVSKENTNNLCLDSSDVSNKIYNHFKIENTI